MTSDTLHPAPPRRTVAWQQLRAVGLGIRTEGALAALLVLGVTALFARQHLSGEWDELPSLVPSVAGPALLVAFFLPLAVWKAEAPEGRTYLWAMPVERGWHQITKGAAGWIWLMAALALYLLWALVIATAMGADVGTETRNVFIGDDFRNRQPTDWYRLVLETRPWEWVVPFVAATIAYLLGSIPTLLSNHPWRWLAGVWFALFCLIATLEATQWEAGARAAQALFANDSWFGLERAFTGSRPVVEHLPGGRAEGVSVERPDLGAWLVAAAFWLGLSAAGAWFAATRHREP